MCNHPVFIVKGGGKMYALLGNLKGKVKPWYLPSDYVFCMVDVDGCVEVRLARNSTVANVYGAGVELADGVVVGPFKPRRYWDPIWYPYEFPPLVTEKDYEWWRAGQFEQDSNNKQYAPEDMIREEQECLHREMCIVASDYQQRRRDLQMYYAERVARIRQNASSEGSEI
jgi:hypothetical protein